MDPEHVNLKEAISSLLTEYTVAIKQLFDSLAIATRTDPTSPQHVFAKLIEKDSKLHNYVAQLGEHQKFQEKLAQLSREMAAQDEQILELATNLKTVEHDLHKNIQNEASHIETIKNSAAHGGISAPDIVSYGHKISYTTSAPAGWAPSTVAVFKPPAPQEEQVRTGLLYAKLPDHILKHFGIEETNKTHTNMPDAQNNGAPEEQASTPPQIDFQKINIPLPPKGWKPGDQISIPLPPKGWKPGDQIFPAGMPEIKAENFMPEDSNKGDVEWE